MRPSRTALLPIIVSLLLVSASPAVAAGPLVVILGAAARSGAARFASASVARVGGRSLGSTAMKMDRGWASSPRSFMSRSFTKRTTSGSLRDTGRLAHRGAFDRLTKLRSGNAGRFLEGEANNPTSLGKRILSNLRQDPVMRLSSSTDKSVAPIRSSSGRLVSARLVKRIGAGAARFMSHKRRLETSKGAKLARRFGGMGQWRWQSFNGVSMAGPQPQPPSRQ